MKKFIFLFTITVLLITVFTTCDKDEKHKNVRGCMCLYTDTNGTLLYYCGAGNDGIPSVWELNEIMYPNPASKNITVEFKTSGERTLTIKKKLGKEVFRETTSNCKLIIDISDFPDGNYVLTIDDGKQKSKWCLFKKS